MQELMSVYVIVDDDYLKKGINLSSPTYFLIIYEISTVNIN